MLLFLCILAMSLLVVGIVYQWAGTRSDLRRYPPPGSLFTVNGTDLHIRVAGSGRPPVIFEAGVAASSVSWRPVQDRIAEFTTTAAYDRAGFAWSGRSKKSSTATEMNDTLRALLTQAGLAPPYILVGHSFGALLVRLYASRWPEEVAGLVLIDPALVQEWGSPDEAKLRMLGRGVSLSRRGGLLAKIGFVRFSLAMLTSGMQFLPKLLSQLTSGKGHSVSSRLVGEVRKLPVELWPAVQSHWCRPESFESMARHLEQLPATAAGVGKLASFCDIPITVISGGHLTGAQSAEHEAIARSSPQGRHIFAKESGHWVHLDQPDTVIEAIREMVSRTTESHQ